MPYFSLGGSETQAASRSAFGAFLTRVENNPADRAKFRRVDQVVDVMLIRSYHELASKLQASNLIFDEEALCAATATALRAKSDSPGTRFAEGAKSGVSEARMLRLFDEKTPDAVMRAIHRMLPLVGACSRMDVAHVTYALARGGVSKERAVRDVTATYYRGK